MQASGQEDISCPNCLRKVPAENEVMHRLYCEKNIKLCPQCQQPMDINDKKMHRCKKYQPVECKACLLKLGDRPLQDHLDRECSERDIKCSYCSVGLPFRLLSGHQKNCAAKTDNCPNCNQVFSRCNREIHQVVCPARDDVDEHLKQLSKKTRPPPRKETKGRYTGQVDRNGMPQDLDLSQMERVMQQSLEQYYRKK